MLNITLTCDNHHTFSGWFADAASLAFQQQQGLIACPECESTTVAPQALPAEAQAVATPKRTARLPRKLIHDLKSTLDEAFLPQVVKLYAPIEELEIHRHQVAALPASLGMQHAEDPDAAAGALSTSVVLGRGGAGLGRASLSEQRDVLKSLEKILKTACRNAGTNFSEEVRRMHYGECAKENLIGHAHPSDIQQLLQEGIDILPLPPFPREDA